MAIDFTKWTGGTFDSLKTWLNTLLESVTSRINNPENVVIGTYIGNGENTREINLGFRPVAVNVYSRSGAQMYYDADYINAGFYYGGLALEDNSSTVVSVTENGFQVRYENWEDNHKYNHRYLSNIKNVKYYFIAYRNYSIQEYE